jgi:phage tail-like protein
MSASFSASASVGGGASASASFGGGAAAAAVAGPRLKKIFFTTMCFYVEIQSLTVAAFSECSLPQMTMETYPYKEGGNNTLTHQLPGRSTQGNVTLKRGLGRRSTQKTGPWDNDLWKWYCDAIQGTIRRHTFSIILYDVRNGERVASWDVIDAYPVKWTGPTFKANESAIAIETLELAHRGVMLA